MKYGNELVCVCVCVCACVSVCVSASVSPEPHARSLAIFVHVAYRRGSVLLWRGDEIPRGRGSFGVFYPLYSIAFGTHTKTADPIKMPFGLMTRAALGTICYMGDPIPKGRGNFGGCQIYWQSSLYRSLAAASLQKGSFSRQ